jgi:hypothetical protein
LLSEKEVLKINFHNEYQEYVEANFQALTDALLPSANQFGFGSIFESDDLQAHKYVMDGLDHYITIQQQLGQRAVPLAYPTAMMLDIAATQLVNTHQLQQPYPQPIYSGGGMFSRLTRIDRLQTLTALENLDIDLYLLPFPFQNNGGMVTHVTDALNRFSMFGFYSEWPAYGTTRSYPPNDRRLEFFPPGWQQAGYPGVALGYRDFRGFLFTMAEVRI